MCDRFSNLWIFKNAVKTNGFWRFLHLLHDRSWDRSLTDLGSILVPKIVPKSDPKRFRKVSKFLVVFDRPPGPPKINFLANTAPTWPQLGPQDGPKLGLKWRQNRTKNGIGSEGGPWTDFGPILDQFGTDFGQILAQNRSKIDPKTVQKVMTSNAHQRSNYLRGLKLKGRRQRR